MGSGNSNPAKQTSMSLLAHVKSHDVTAWQQLVDLYSPLVYYWCQKSGLPDQEIRDVFQDVFCSIAKNINQFQPKKSGTFRGWLRTVTRNKVIDHLRKSQKEPFPIGGTAGKLYFEQLAETDESVSDNSNDTNRAALESDFAKGEEMIHHELLKKALSAVRSSFQEQSWKAFWMVAVDGKDASEVAIELGMRPGTVRVAKSRVLKRLREYLGDTWD